MHLIDAVLGALLHIYGLGSNPSPCMVYLVGPQPVLPCQALVHLGQHHQCSDPKPTRGHKPRNNEEHRNYSGHQHGVEDDEQRGGYDDSDVGLDENEAWEEHRDPPAIVTETVLIIWQEMGCCCWRFAIVKRVMITLFLSFSLIFGGKGLNGIGPLSRGEGLGVNYRGKKWHVWKGRGFRRVVVTQVDGDFGWTPSPRWYWGCKPCKELDKICSGW